MQSIESAGACALAQHGISALLITRPDDSDEELAAALASVQQHGTLAAPLEIIVVETRAQLPRLPESARCVHLPSAVVGAARQAGLEAARGAFVAWCDAGDVWSPGQLGALYAVLRDNAGLAMAYASPDEDDFDRARLVADNYIALSDSLTRRAALQHVGGFDLSADSDEDWDLWLRVSEQFALARVRRQPAARRERPQPARRPPAPVIEQLKFRERMINARRLHMQQRLRGLQAFDPDTWRAGRRELIMQAPFTNAMSFGVVTRELALGLERRGVQVEVGPMRSDPVAGFERFYERKGAQDRLALYFDFRVGPCGLRAERIVRYTMWESTYIPHEQITETNATCALVYVPCRQNVKDYLARGLRAPLKLLRHGVNSERFPLLERPRTGDEPYTFGAIGAFSPRKGIDALMRAFTDEFRPHEHVRLLLKASNTDHGLRPSDPRIQVLEGFYDDARLLDYLRSLDAFVLPSRGEGFGLPGVEAMATGLPLIATNWSGPADYLDPADSFPLDYTLTNPGGTGAHGARFWGRWAEPSHEHLRALLRRLFDERASAAAMGIAAAARMRRDWSWDDVVAQLVSDLDALALGMTPGDVAQG
jgi:glycosyltransferase involved in cell wall biosynthesis